ncbi:KTSC domain-containing protein [Pedobacter sp. Leaf170]|uniref:KTSC domain-containing protein n=1 Tax=Pedobacter sp. Leaf170 TaxID=2876558 RepID=UPI001E599388|nr:KTSC domain-containing protein [Pedobacter sp. Leaf170]
MKTIKIDGITYNVNAKINGFKISQKTSSNVAFFGLNSETNQLFVQFKNGSSYIYSELDSSTVIEIINCESIGKFISGRIVKVFPSEKLEGEMIKMHPSESEKMF